MAKINIKLTKQQQQYLAVGVVLFGAFCYVYIAFFWSPISKRTAEVQKQIEEVEAKIDKAQRQAARLPRLEAEILELNAKAVEAEKRLPRKKSVPDILVTLSALAEKYHVVLVSFTPGQQKSLAFFNELNYPVSVKGSFHNIGKFLAAVALEERIFSVQNVIYGEPAGEAGEMAVNFTLIAYQYKG